MRLFLILVAATVVVCGQRPVIHGVVNAASYATGGPSGKAVAGGSIVSVFGRNLSTVTQSASAFPLPTTLGGTSVTVNGIAAPIFYVSPGQLNIQLRSGTLMVVTTSAGSSDPVPLDLWEGFGIFTLDASGCGRGAVFNVASDGSVSLNSPSNSASPGDFITVYGTGLVGFFNAPPDGSPAPSDPPSLAMSWGLYYGAFDLAPSFPSTPLRAGVSWAGRAPGFVGLDQVNVRIPDTVREGCAVPLMIGATHAGRSQPIPISIRKEGGACIDPPTAGYGLITWERTVASGTEPGRITEAFTAAFASSPGKQPPPPMEFEGVGRSRVIEDFGPSCPLPGYTNLDASSVTIEGPGLSPVEAAAELVEGQRVYRAVLPDGTIRPGSFSVTASGGDVGSFQSSLRIGAGINITSSFPPGTVVRLPATGGPRGLTANWTGGDPDTWVTLKVVSHQGVSDIYSFIQARASSGTATIATAGLPPGRGEIILEVTPDPAQIPALSAPGLALGGQHLWKYTYRFGGLTLQ